MTADFVLSKHGVGRLIHRSPELFLRNVRRVHPTKEQRFQSLTGLLKSWRGTLFHRGQGGLNDIVNRVIAMNDRLDALFLFWGEMDSHVFLCSFSLRRTRLRGATF